MKTKIITTKDYLLLIDEEAEININDYWIYLNSNEDFDGVVTKSNLTEKDWYDKLHNRFEYKKVTAYYPLNSEAKELDLPLLPPFEEDKYIKDLAQQRWGNVHRTGVLGFIEGYRAAQSKQFSLEDIKKAIEMARKTFISDKRPIDRHSTEEIIQSISTQQLPKEFVPEIIIINQDYRFNEGQREELKTTTNSEGKETLIGTYKY